MEIENGIIEEIIRVRESLHVKVSYETSGKFEIKGVSIVILIVDRSTIIINRSGKRFLAGSLREGMRINAVVSERMTRSNPPQTQAYRITILSGLNHSTATTGRILEINRKQRSFLIGEWKDIYSQIRFTTTEHTLILNRRGHRIPLTELTQGQRVRVKHANFQTSSIPPQTTAFVVQEV